MKELRGLTILFLLGFVYTAPHRKASHNLLHRRSNAVKRNQHSRPNLKESYYDDQSAANDWYESDDRTGDMRGEIADAENAMSTGVEPPSMSSMDLSASNPILWSEGYNGKKIHGNVPAPDSLERGRHERSKQAKKPCRTQTGSHGHQSKRDGGDCGMGDQGGLLPGHPHLAQQDMSNDPTLQDMPNTVGPNPNIFGGFPENDIWGNFELPSPETIDHLKLALKMNRHRPSYAEDQASDAIDQHYGYEHHALPEYDILETPAFQHILWQNAQVQQILKAGSNGCAPGMGSCPPINNEVTCENLHQACAANAQHKPQQQPEYDPPCPDKILAMFGCGGKGPQPPMEKPEDDAAIPVKAPEKPAPAKEDEKEEKKPEKEAKPTPIPIDIPGQNKPDVPASIEKVQKMLANHLGTIETKAKLTAASAIKELSDNLKDIAETEGKKLPESADLGLAEIMEHARTHPHEKHLITQVKARQSLHADHLGSEVPSRSHGPQESGSTIASGMQAASYAQPEEELQQGSSSADDSHKALESQKIPESESQKISENEGKNGMDSDMSVALMTVLGHDLEKGIQQKLKEHGNTFFGAGKLEKLLSKGKLRVDKFKSDSAENTAMPSKAQHQDEDVATGKEGKVELASTFQALNGEKTEQGGKTTLLTTDDLKTGTEKGKSALSMYDAGSDVVDIRENSNTDTTSSGDSVPSEDNSKTGPNTDTSRLPAFDQKTDPNAVYENTANRQGTASGENTTPEQTGNYDSRVAPHEITGSEDGTELGQHSNSADIPVTEQDKDGIVDRFTGSGDNYEGVVDSTTTNNINKPTITTKQHEHEHHKQPFSLDNNDGLSLKEKYAIWKYLSNQIISQDAETDNAQRRQKTKNLDRLQQIVSKKLLLTK